ncbi:MULTISPECIES: ParM/StbA family protein [Pseudoalteromonas]|uniref:ParM/StbA family protein n=1 Tax=Pseudoalteromonas agarivorans TaxID=176102 RepID=A0AAD0XF31_9GAMM|nr:MULTISPECIES: ParM/StbA family protein [Pseudoalteromonas]AYM89019.1 ParM/StbA family protein [Pseudoalteromonas agarivorans]MAD75041.1 plasmid stability protein StbA [Rheinheimera sp.]MCK8103074.1 ParM/StbA family protein [Pseudoalteromonas sp. 2CM36K]|tara:strand:- start:3286 stop:4266 length:981 start_codon:yes stop_codon:yes gene_type:complete
MFVMGLDIGYSNLKVSMGTKGEDIRTKILPAGAGNIDLMPRSVGAGLGTDFLQVIINDQKWAAGVEPDRLQGWERELHKDYKSTDVYRALFYAALLVSEQSVIDVLVTGLPVDQAMKDEQRQELASLLKGEHQITPKRKVTVKDVIVVPQPAGAYMDVVNSAVDDDVLDVIHNGKTVVIDPGYYSVDWVALVEGEIHYRSSGTSLKAMSRLIQVANELIHDDNGAAPGIDKIEKAIRTGKSYIYLFGQKIELKEYMENASNTVSREALTSMKKTMRDDGMDADVVLLAGGGASSYMAAAKELFSKSRIIELENSVLSNSRGFWYCG